MAPCIAALLCSRVEDTGAAVLATLGTGGVGAVLGGGLSGGVQAGILSSRGTGGVEGGWLVS